MRQVACVTREGQGWLTGEVCVAEDFACRCEGRWESGEGEVGENDQEDITGEFFEAEHLGLGMGGYSEGGVEGGRALPS